MLTISLETVEWIVQKAREFDGKDVDTRDVGRPDPYGDDTEAMGVLEDRSDDPSEHELRSWISDLPDDQAAELVAVFWTGRDDADPSDFAELVDRAQTARSTPTADYLLGSPHLADHLEAGLEVLGVRADAAEAR